MKDIIKIPISIVFYFIAVVGCLSVINICKNAILNYEVYYAFLVGLIVPLLLSRLRRNSMNIEFIRTFTHELTHVLFSWLFLNKVSNFNASAMRGGEVYYYGKSNFVISLSPYCVPIYTLFIILLTPFLKSSLIIDGLIGVTYMFHLITFWKQCNINQPDINQHGLLFSYSFIALVNIYIGGVVLIFIKSGSLSSFWKFGALIIDTIMKFI